jgi:hypothetical protein
MIQVLVAYTCNLGYFEDHASRPTRAKRLARSFSIREKVECGGVPLLFQLLKEV